MKTRDLMAGMSIILKYYDSQDGYHTACEHDQIYMIATDRPISTEHVNQLHAHGWFQEGIDEPDYSLDETWSAFV